MNADNEKKKRTLLILYFLGQLFFYGGFVVMLVCTILGRLGVVDGRTALPAIPVMIFGFAMAWGAGNNRAIVELQDRVAALEKRTTAEVEPDSPYVKRAVSPDA